VRGEIVVNGVDGYKSKISTISISDKSVSLSPHSSTSKPSKSAGTEILGGGLMFLELGLVLGGGGGGREGTTGAREDLLIVLPVGEGDGEEEGDEKEGSS
jgi:hypothetical protein